MGTGNLVTATQTNSETPTRRERVLVRVQEIIDREWPLPTFRAVAGVWLALLGVLAEKQTIFSIIAIILSIVVLAGAEWLLLDTSKYIRRRAEQKAETKFEAGLSEAAKKVRSAEVSRAANAAAEEFLAERLTRATGLLSNVLRAKAKDREAAASQGLKKIESINEALRALCSAHSAIASKSRDVELPDAWFQATYMEVQMQESIERLVYVGWHTRGERQPRSMIENVTFGRGERKLAVSAWNTKRAAIMNFKSGDGEWTDNYAGQSGKYRSMMSVPVLRPEGRDPTGHVIGVITVGTSVDDYFGVPKDSDAEERAMEWAAPYCTYIAFISVAHDAIRRVVGGVSQ